jgi:hypothetical protein
MITPDERAFRADVEMAPFLLGAAEGRWRLIAIVWPHVMMGVTAKDGSEYVFRFSALGFPENPPTATLWDVGRNAQLATSSWPQSHGGRLGAVFRTDWKGGSALYLPCDREAIAGHDNWRTAMPSKIWSPSIGIVQYLELVHELLHSRDYVPPIRTAA